MTICATSLNKPYTVYDSAKNQCLEPVKYGYNDPCGNIIDLNSKQVKTSGTPISIWD